LLIFSEQIKDTNYKTENQKLNIINIICKLFNYIQTAVQELVQMQFSTDIREWLSKEVRGLEKSPTPLQ